MIHQNITFSVKSIGVAVKIVIVTGLFLMNINSAIAGQRLSVNVNVANVRSGAGTSHGLLWQVEKYHPIIVLKSQGRWYKFRDFEGDTAWIHKSLVRKTPTVITTKKKCNIRSGPSTKYKVLFTAERGIPFRILSRKETWIKVQHVDGDKGWIYKSLVW